MKSLIINLLNHFPRLKLLLRGLHHHLFPNSSVSSHYVSLEADRAGAEGQRLRAAWKDNALPSRQRELVEQQLLQYRAGARVDVFDVFVQALRELPDLTEGMSLLEIGCSSGFYSEVLDIARLPLKYTGCDYSLPFIQMAREKYPTMKFAVEDATELQFPDRSFDIVVSGCCLLHIPEYAEAVAETVRVSRQYVVFHRTPVVWGQPEKWYRKQAYGIETVEIHFNEPAFLELLHRNDLELLATYTLREGNSKDDRAQGDAVRTYVCRK